MASWAWQAEASFQARRVGNHRQKPAVLTQPGRVSFLRSDKVCEHSSDAADECSACCSMLELLVDTITNAWRHLLQRKHVAGASIFAIVAYAPVSGALFLALRCRYKSQVRCLCLDKARSSSDAAAPLLAQRTSWA
jgi:hypothetical protein